MLLLLQELEDTVVSCLTVPGFMQLLEAGGSRHDVLYGFAERYVEAYIRDRPEELEVHDVVKKAAAKLQSVFAAIVVMLNPIAGIFGTTPAAVSLIVENTDKTNGFLNAVSTVMTNHAFWQRQIDDCLLKGPASMKHANTLKELTEELRAENEDESQQHELSDLLRKLPSVITDLKKTLRVDATRDLEALVKTRLSRLCKWTLQKTDVSGLSGDHVDVLQKLLNVFSNDKDMLASSTHLKSWSGKMSKVVGLAALKDLAEAQEGELSFKEVAELLDGIGDAITEEHRLMMHSLASKILESLHTKAVGGETVRLLRCSLSLSLSCSRAIESR